MSFAFDCRGRLHTRRLVLSLGILCAMSAIIPASKALAQKDNIQALIEQLGAEEFRTREEASMELMRIGEPALLALSAAEQGSDFEIRERAKAIRGCIERQKYDALAQTFMRDTDPTASYGLPGWKSFSSVAGTTRTAKRLFLEMIEKRRIVAMCLESIDGGQLADGVFEGLPADPQKRLWTVVGKMSSEIRRKLFEGDRPVHGDVLALLVSAAVLEETPQDLHDAIRNEINFGGVEMLMAQPSSRICIRKLLGKWMLNAPLSSGEDVIRFAHQYQVPQGANMARRLLSTPSDKEMIAKALLCLGWFGNPSDFDLIDKYVDDMTVLSLDPMFPAEGVRVEQSGGPRSGAPSTVPEVQVKYRRLVSDVAIAAGLHIANPDLLRQFFPYIRILDDHSIVETTISFPVDRPEIRDAAVKAWREIRAKRDQPAS